VAYGFQPSALRAAFIHQESAGLGIDLHGNCSMRYPTFCMAQASLSTGTRPHLLHAVVPPCSRRPPESGRLPEAAIGSEDN